MKSANLHEFVRITRIELREHEFARINTNYTNGIVADLSKFLRLDNNYDSCKFVPIRVISVNLHDELF